MRVHVEEAQQYAATHVGRQHNAQQTPTSSVASLDMPTRQPTPPPRYTDVMTEPRDDRGIHQNSKHSIKSYRDNISQTEEWPWGEPSGGSRDGLTGRVQTHSPSARRPRCGKFLLKLVVCIVTIGLLFCTIRAVRSSRAGKHSWSWYPPPSYPRPDDSSTTIIDQKSGNIHGTFYLKDTLHLKTNSGNINARVVVDPATNDSYVPARFKAKCSSGNIAVHFIVPNEHLPRRDYQVDVEANSGWVHGTYPLGSATSIRTNSGGINTQLMSVDGNEAASLHTKSNSGPTRATISEPMYGKSLKRLSAQHFSNSGSLSVEYPESWEGKIRATAVSGTVDVWGPEVKVGHIGNVVEAAKGNGQGFVELKANSGKVEVYVR